MESLCSISLLKKTEYIPSIRGGTFIIRCLSPPSEDLHFLEFLFRFDRPLFWPAAGLNLEPLNVTPECFP